MTNNWKQINAYVVFKWVKIVWKSEVSGNLKQFEACWFDINRLLHPQCEEKGWGWKTGPRLQLGYWPSSHTSFQRLSEISMHNIIICIHIQGDFFTGTPNFSTKKKTLYIQNIRKNIFKINNQRSWSTSSALMILMPHCLGSLPHPSTPSTTLPLESTITSPWGISHEMDFFVEDLQNQGVLGESNPETVH